MLFFSRGFCFFCIFCISMAHLSYAVEYPAPGKFDKRVRFIKYNPQDIVRLVGHFGFSTHIKFSPSEKILQIAMGDPEAWDISPVNNHIFLKPIGDDAKTNMTVISSKRIYNFILDAEWPSENDQKPDSNMLFQVNFIYPKNEKSIIKNNKNKINNKKIKDFIDKSLSSLDHANPRNWDYWFKGSDDIKPDLIFDDGRFTYFKFANNREMPAMYTVNDDNSESLVNTHINPVYPDVIVVHKVKKRFILRKGKSATCIFNKSFDSRGIGIPTGTTSPNVIRVIKEK